MILDPFKPAFHGKSNQMLIRMSVRDRERLVEQWDEEAQEAVLDGKPEKGQYIEWMIVRLLQT